MKTKPVDWFSSLLDMYEKHGQGWRNADHARLATECYAYFMQTGSQRHLDDCDKYLLSALPEREDYEKVSSSNSSGNE